PELAKEPKERIFAELEKALATEAPSIFFRNLENASLLQIIFPRLHDLIGKTQPEFCHPEGDAFEHTMLAADRAASMTDRVEVRFAALMHDIGKGATDESILPHHYGHEKAGLRILKEIEENFPLPKRWRQCAEIAIEEHMRAPRLTHPGKIVELLVRISKHPVGFDGFCAVILADCGCLPEYLERHEKYMAAILSAHKEAIPPALSGGEIGVWLRQKEIEAFMNAQQAP
ncbi:HD domain-containing protein, partial [Synergistaceae bacterium OttesenSCG-928-D05]|nr:HD domain-containing protein [Synergistaceae bacterium OttesenSCG-928-D05]